MSKKHLSLIIAAAVAANLASAYIPFDPKIPAASAESYFQPSVYDDLEYMISGYEDSYYIIITRYVGEGGDVVIPDTIEGYPVTELESSAFMDNQSIGKVTLPDSIVWFGKAVFAGSSVTEVNIPAELKILPDRTFENCTSLTGVKWNEKLIYASDRAFTGTDITLPADRTFAVSSSDVLNSDTLTVREGFLSAELHIGHSTGTYYAIADGYGYLGDIPDEGIDVVIPDEICGEKIISLSDSFFSDINSRNIKAASLTFPRYMDEYAFTASMRRTFPPNINKIVFRADHPIIKRGSFSGIGLTEVEFAGSCDINENSFRNTKELKKVVFSGECSDISISEYAFKDCTSLEEIVFPEKINSISIGSEAFAGCALNSLSINGDGTISDTAFSGCSSFRNISLNGTLNIKGYTFKDCEDLSEVFIGKDVSLEPKVFISCAGLTSIRTDAALDELNGSAFNSCPALMNINGEPVNTENGDLKPEFRDALLKSFWDSEDIGFINTFIRKRMKDVTDEVITDGMTDVQKAKALHDWVCDNTSYNYDSESAFADHNDLSVFIGRPTVCEGYARTLNLLLHQAGIDSCYLNSDDHAWVMAKLGGHWFHIDATWDDGDIPGHDWFLLTDEQIRSTGGSHSTWRIFKPSTLHSFQQDELPASTEKMGDINGNGMIDGSDATLILAAYADLSSGSTPDIDTVLADINSDGMISGVDATKVLGIYADLSSQEEN